MSPKKEKLLNDTYYKWIQTVLYDLPLDGANDFVDPEIMGYGTAIDEKVLSISDYREMVNRQRKQAIGLEMSFESTPVFRSISNKEDSAIFVDEIKVSIIFEEGKQELFLRLTTILEYIKSKWIVVHLHGSMPTETTAETDTWLVNEWQRKNEELQKLVDEKTSELLNKNRELEIETALEKVRSSALAMKEPGDMVEVCRIISDQLQSLGVKDIRNVQTAIINEQKGSYLNYQYFTAYNKSIIEEAEYNKHPKAREMAETMKKSVEAFFSQSFDGEELNVFREYRKQDNQFPDPILDEAASLHFYFYSIGPGALGISTYNTPLSESDMHLLKRFRNVFELAYRRFIDIELAIAQAREAKTEAALEKVRAVAMSMNKPDDLLNVCEVLFKEFQKLEFGELRNAMINIHNDEKETFLNYDYSDAIEKSINHLTYNIHPVIEKQIKQIRSANDAFSETSFTGKDLEEWKKFRKKIGEKDDPRINEISALYYYFYSIGTGSIGISTFSSINEEKLELLKRFRNVFSLSYQRYTDIALAEAQARESQIELALERVRARTMGMQKSEELKDVIRIVYEQFVHLNILVEHSGFIMDYKARDDMHIWLADQHEVPFQITIPYFNSPHWNSFIEAKEKGIDFFANHLTFKEKNKFYKVLFKLFPVPDEAKEYYFSCPGLAISTVLLENVSLYIENFSGIPYTDEENKTLMRFGKVFQQTYTRFLDLQKAEAQTREAQIEASLERVRSKAMSMHSPNDLSETVNVFFKELKTLGIIPIRCGVGQIDEATRTTSLTTTTSSQQGESFQVIGKVKQTGHPVLDGIFDHWKLQKEYHPVLEGENIKAYYNVMNPQIGYPEYPEGITQFGNNFFFKEGFVFAWTVDLLSEEELIIFRRFTSVLSLTYRRYMDLREAEEKNKIIQADNERKTKELEDARQLQLSMLPKELPQLPHLDIVVYMKTATEVGGDYYDFNVDQDGTLTVLVGDATGHGMMSGMMVSIMKSFFISNKNNIELKQFFENSNNSIKDMHLGRLMMASIGVQITNEKVIATNAGMPSLLYFRNKSKKAGEFVSNNLPLGGMKGTKYLLKEIKYEKGDTLLLMSDGLAELKNENDEQFGYTRVKEEFMLVAQKNPNEIVEHYKDSASQWIKGIEPDDDVTFVVIKVK